MSWMVMLMILSAQIVSAPVSAREAAPGTAFRVLFGHQPVGNDILAGLNRVAPELLAGPANPGGPILLIDRLVGQNGSPVSKIEAFEKEVMAQSATLDAALFKLCYVDFDATTDVPHLFSVYASTHDRLRQAYPGLILAHITAPLTTIQSSFKSWVKQMLGKSPRGLVENLKRSEFNTLLRARYAGKEPIFDLAELESRSPAGEMVSYEGRVPMLHPAYSYDGGHLNETGQGLIGGAFADFLRILAADPGEPANAKRRAP